VAITAPSDGQVLKWSGPSTSWVPAADNSGSFTLPYTATQTDAGTLFSVTNQGTGRAGQFFVDNVSNSVPPLSSSTNGTGFAFVGEGQNFGVAGTATIQGGAGGYFYNSADRGYGLLAGLNTAGTASSGALGTTYLQDGVYFGVGVQATGDDYGVRATGGIYGGEFLRSSGTVRVL
jgi:hypothetical protein